MSARELECTDEFLAELTNNPSKFKSFLSTVAAKLKGPNVITFPTIENAIKEVYEDNDVIAPDTEIIHYVFDGLIFTQPITVKESVLANLLRQLHTEHRNNINKE
jgi:hypothetical protein